ncbi:MAG: hypothetical protein RI841_13455 [Halomonas sp.]|uniref:hypothetical protein n=1 Tax=Halomonas sp. TaxID=1486246 RepID=UPI00286FCDBE|nr:hypothetical protein [Halomonas sp.]MDR9440481.1 hypothetical protein [Halomonas sp.]
MIDFLLNGQPRHCSASPDTSVLELLRDSLGPSGTKEGCATGDCGADGAADVVQALHGDQRGLDPAKLRNMLTNEP